MKKVIMTVACTSLLLSGCTTYAGVGAYQGSGIGAILGSAIGGIAGGPRGSDIGTIIGMAGGAVVGAAVGSAAEQAQQQRREEVRERRSRDYQYERGIYGNRDYDSRGYDNSGFDPTNSGDDRIYDYNDQDYNGSYSAVSPRSYDPMYSNGNGSSITFNPELEIRNARFVDDDRDNVLRASETSKVIFEVYNNSDRVLYDVQPIVEETSGARQIFISPSIHVEKISPHRGIRYTATVQAGNRLRDGRARFRVRAIQGKEQVTSRITEFDIRTSRR